MTQTMVRVTPESSCEEPLEVQGCLDVQRQLDSSKNSIFRGLIKLEGRSHRFSQGQNFCLVNGSSRKSICVFILHTDHLQMKWATLSLEISQKRLETLWCCMSSTKWVFA